MPNARDAHAIAHHRFLTLGLTGSGKTAQFATLPGRKFMYIFDANALPTLRGRDIEYEIFLPSDLNLDVHSLSKDKSGAKIMSQRKSEVYTDWERDFSSRDFSKYETIGFDSITTFLDLIMDYVLTINGRPGQWPNQDDYGPQMVTFTNVMRSLNSLGKILYCTGHIEYIQDDLSKKIFWVPIMTGRLKGKIPLLFSDILGTSHEVDKETQSTYMLQTKPIRDVPNIRCSIRGLEMYENVTIDYDQPVEGQGLGGILAWEADQLREKEPPPTSKAKSKK
jgi:hypothetical protein